MPPFALLFALACSQPSVPSAPAPEAPEPAASDPEALAAADNDAKMTHPRPDWEVKQHMDMHFQFATEALFMAFDGNLEGIHSEAKKLAEHEPIEEAPAAWKPYVDKMHTRAVELQNAPTVEESGKSLALLAGSCADCHLANKGPDVTLKQLAYDETLFGDGVMDRHEWAAYLMWIGLVVPDDDIYAAGTKALAHRASELPEVSDGSKKLEMRLHDIGGRAFSAKTAHARRDAFAAFITTCSECHAENNVELPK